MATRRAAGGSRQGTVRSDLTAGVVLGVESVPDGLASGVLAGVNPLAGLYAYLFGMLGAAFFTSSTFMAVQATGAMSLVVADTDLSSRPDPDRALYTLAVLTGVIMLVAGLLRGGSLLRFVPTAVMTGFVTAVGVNIVLGQLAGFTGAETTGSNRVARTVDLLLHPGLVHLPSLVVGVVTLVAILVLTRTRLGSMGLVAAMILGSVLAAWLTRFADTPVALVRDVATIPNALPRPVLPSLSDVLYLLVPAVSLAFIGLVQGAAVSVGVPNPDRRPADASRDFVGQGVGNLVSGLFRGMPVGGSMSASALVSASGARSRWALAFAGGVMALVILVLGGVVGMVAMPAIAALLIVVGASSVKPAKVVSVVRTGTVQTVVLALTFVLTLVVPVQYAVLIGVAFAILMHVVEQSNRVRVTRLVLDDEGGVREVPAPASLPAAEVVVLQPYGSLFFASAPAFRDQLPVVDADSVGSVVILRMRGIDQLGLSLMDVMRRYAQDLHEHGGQLKLVINDQHVARQLAQEGLTDLLGTANVYMGNEWRGATLRRAHADAMQFVESGGGPT
jgi:SulP family sulfate permease